MYKDKDYKEIIERFLDGEMSASEEASFKQELSSNQDLSQEFDLYQMASFFINQTNILSVQEGLQSIEAEYKSKLKRTRNFKIFGGLGLAISVGIASLYFWKTDNITEEDSSIKSIDTNEPLLGLKFDSIQFSEIEMGKESSSVEENKPFLAVEINKESKNISTSKKIPNKEFVNKEPEITVLKSVEFKISKLDNPVKESNKAVSQARVAGDEVAVVSCDNVKINFTTQVNSTCSGKSSGKILVSEAKGGRAPYQYSLITKETNANGTFLDLKQGVYELIVKDLDGCESRTTATVKSEVCNVDLFFTPNNGDQLRFPVYEKVGELTIFDKKGEVKFSSSIEAFESFVWDGETNNGKLEPAYYIFLIKYSDGQIQKGSVTITP